MNISKFLVIDAVFVIGAIPILLMIKGAKQNSSLRRNSNNEKVLIKTCQVFPEKEKLIELEKLAINQGSGIEFNSLMGDWKFVSVWKKNSDEEDSVFSSLLKVFSAKIKFKKNISTESSHDFTVFISIQFALFKIAFSGSGYLKGKQPLLSFFINKIELKSGSNILFQRPMEEPKEKDKSFFAIIALEENGTCLSARVNGGAVVIWMKD